MHELCCKLVVFLNDFNKRYEYSGNFFKFYIIIISESTIRYNDFDSLINLKNRNLHEFLDMSFSVLKQIIKVKKGGIF